MTVLYVTSDVPQAGKTTFCISLAHMLNSRGKSAVVFKPFADGESDADADAVQKLLGQNTDGWPLELPDSGVSSEVLGRIKDALDVVAKDAEIVLVEGANRLSTGATARIVESLDAKVLMVARFDRELSSSKLKSKTSDFSDRLLGVVINGRTRYMAHESETKLSPSLVSDGLPVFGVIPEDRRLLGVSVAQIAESLGGRFLVCENNSDALVEHLLIGVLTMESGELYFGLHDNKAVIVRGDRPDLQMSALGTPTSCLVLTRGIEPIEYVAYEAEQEEVSVMVVETDTMTTMTAVNTLIESSRFDHPLKLERAVELIQEHVDVGALLRALGMER